MEIQGSCVDGCQSWNCEWEPTRAWTSETHRHSVPSGLQAMVTECKISLGKKPTKEMLADILTKHVDAATMSNCMTTVGMKFQWGESKLTLKA